MIPKYRTARRVGRVVAAVAVAGAATLPALAASATEGGGATTPGLISLSGGGCLLAGGPGRVQVGLVFDGAATGSPVRVLPVLGEPDAAGVWAVTNTQPEGLAPGPYLAVPACVDPSVIDPADPGRIPTDPAKVKLLGQHTLRFTVPPDPAPTTTTAAGAGSTRTTRPATVRATPRYTG